MLYKEKKCTKCGRSQQLTNFYIDRHKTDGHASHCSACIKNAAANYRILNRDKCLATANAHYNANKTEIRRSKRKHPDVPGQGMYNKLYPNHYDFGAYKRKPFGESSFLRLVKNYQKSAKKRNMVFSLTNNDIRSITSMACHYCGISPQQVITDKTAYGYYLYNGIDRVDSLCGYELMNCVPCCKICNRAKTNMPITQWNEWLNRVVTFRTAANAGFKVTLKNDESPKSLVKK